MSFTGTVLGGPHDGKIITADQPRMRMPRPVTDVPSYVADEPIELDMTDRIDDYVFERDDDMRGWWVLRP